MKILTRYIIFNCFALFSCLQTHRHSTSLLRCWQIHTHSQPSQNIHQPQPNKPHWAHNSLHLQNTPHHPPRMPQHTHRHARRGQNSRPSPPLCRCQIRLRNGILRVFEHDANTRFSKGDGSIHPLGSIPHHE